MRSSEDYLLCHQLVYWYVLLVLDLRRQDRECSVAAGKAFDDEWSLDSDVVARFCVGRGD